MLIKALSASFLLALINPVGWIISDPVMGNALLMMISIFLFSMFKEEVEE